MTIETNLINSEKRISRLEAYIQKQRNQVENRIKSLDKFAYNKNAVTTPMLIGGVGLPIMILGSIVAGPMALVAGGVIGISGMAVAGGVSLAQGSAKNKIEDLRRELRFEERNILSDSNSRLIQLKKRLNQRIKEFKKIEMENLQNHVNSKNISEQIKKQSHNNQHHLNQQMQKIGVNMQIQEMQEEIKENQQTEIKQDEKNKENSIDSLYTDFQDFKKNTESKEVKSDAENLYYDVSKEGSFGDSDYEDTLAFYGQPFAENFNEEEFLKEGQRIEEAKQKMEEARIAEEKAKAQEAMKILEEKQKLEKQKESTEEILNNSTPMQNVKLRNKNHH